VSLGVSRHLKGPNADIFQGLSDPRNTFRFFENLRATKAATRRHARLSSAHTSSEHCSPHCLHQSYCWTSWSGNTHTATQRHVSNDAYAGEVGFQYSTVHS